MSNMSYCRFQNTVQDLQDCYDNMGSIGEYEDDVSDNDRRELKSRERLIKLCVDIAIEYGDDIGQSVELNGF
jgi:hypothetical protein